MRRLYTFYFALLMLLMVFVSIETVWAQMATFNCTNGAQQLVVPNGVFTIHIQAFGAEGGQNTQELAGEGGFAEGDLAVTPGNTLDIFVGCAGSLQTSQSLGGGGFNGGGDAFTTSVTQSTARGGGGGASDVRQGGDQLDDRVIVAGGGGGACVGTDEFGGDGDEPIGEDGGSSDQGLGGEQATGGTGFSDCDDGVKGIGGNSDTGGVDCAGGGGGFFGGGSGCGAGGGSSYIGGVMNGNTSTGGRQGDGMVVLTAIGINLSPDVGINDVFTDHTVTAILLIPEQDVLVTFEVTSGPNVGLVSIPGTGECSPNDCKTDSNGQVSWTYSSLLVGVDVIVASYTDTFDQVLGSNDVLKAWLGISEFIILSPTTATNNIKTNHTVTATVEIDGVLSPDVLVTFEIISGPNAGEMSDPGSGECSPNDCETDSQGQVSWTYSGESPGTDLILASFTDQGGQDLDSTLAEKTWVNLQIPTLSQWGLIAMAGVLGIVGFMVMRRRKVRA